MVNYNYAVTLRALSRHLLIPTRHLSFFIRIFIYSQYFIILSSTWHIIFRTMMANTKLSFKRSKRAVTAENLKKKPKYAKEEMFGSDDEAAEEVKKKEKKKVCCLHHI